MRQKTIKLSLAALALAAFGLMMGFSNGEGQKEKVYEAKAAEIVEIKEAPIFSEITIHPVEGGTRAEVWADSQQLDDDLLINFFEAYIYGSPHQWFTLWLGDDEAYIFSYSTLFLHAVGISEDGLAAGGSTELGIGWLDDDGAIVYNRPLQIPTFETVSEFRDWAADHDIYLQVIDKSTGEIVEDGTYIVRIGTHPIYGAGDTLIIKVADSLDDQAYAA